MASPKDCTGRELKVGQKVAHTGHAQHRGITVSKVLRITPKMVELAHKAYSSAGLTKREHSYVAIVEDVE